MFTIKQYNTIPSLEATLVDYLNQPVNLTAASVTFSMRSLDDPSLVVGGDAVFVDRSGGIVAYEWDLGDTAVHGAFIGEFRVTFQDGSSETYPNSDYIRVHVVKSAGNAP